VEKHIELSQWTRDGDWARIRHTAFYPQNVAASTAVTVSAEQNSAAVIHFIKTR